MNFNIDILKYLGNKHICLMNDLKDNINNFNTNKDIYDYINNFMLENKLERAFPIGISINHVIAHDSYHKDNLIILKINDFITIDVGFIENGNIIDAARTFIYKNNNKPKCILDCEKYVDKIEEYIKNELNKHEFVKIQNISELTEILVSTGGYTGLDYLGGHNVELNCVHGNKLILNKSLKSLPNYVSKMINKDETLSTNEMFCIEIYMSESFTQGQMIKSTRIPITHYELSKNTKNDELDDKELKIFEILKETTNMLAYEYFMHDDFNKNDKKIINNMIKKGYIIEHHPLEFKTTTGNLVKFVQHENTFLINENNELINLTRDNSL